VCPAAPARALAPEWGGVGPAPAGTVAQPWGPLDGIGAARRLGDIGDLGRFRTAAHSPHDQVDAVVLVGNAPASNDVQRCQLRSSALGSARTMVDAVRVTARLRRLGVRAQRSEHKPRGDLDAPLQSV
jgi:hypothetical protein